MHRDAIYIPFENFTSIGGPSTFMINLKNYLDSQKYTYFQHPHQAQAIFFPVSYDLTVLNEIKRRNGKIIQRLDGIYYPSKHPDSYIEKNKDIKEIYLNYADFVVFQSEYSKKQCFSMFGEKTADQYTLIFNGVNKKIFYPAFEKKELGQKIKLVTTGNFRNPDMLEPVIKALDILEHQLNFELTVVGPVVNPSLEPFLKRKYVNYVGPKGLEEVAGILRDSDIFVYSHLNPPCPNSVIEAISCGLPVAGFDSGSMSELLYFSKELLAPVSGEVFQKYEDFDPDKLARKILFLVENYHQYRQRALEHSYLYSFEECGRQYVEVFERFLTKPDRLAQCKRAAGQILKRTGKLIKIINPGVSKLHNAHEDLNIDSGLILSFVRQKAKSLPPADSLRFLFDIENKLYQLQGEEAVRYGNGVHTKHKHIKYHDFFINNIPEGSRVLDIGCGNGALAFDIASKVPEVIVLGIDISETNIAKAQTMFSRSNIRYVSGDALTDLPDEKFDVIVLSNVLEHIKERIDLLKTLQNRYRPRKILIRVPVFERDWRVPLKKELGIDYRLDDTHYIEYLQEEFFEEMKQAGLIIKHNVVKWGEVWAEAVPSTNGT